MAGKGRSPEAETQLPMNLSFSSSIESSELTRDPFRSTTQDPEEFMANWAFMFESRKGAARELRDRFDAQMADHEFQEFLKRIGAVTQSERRAYLNQVVTPEEIAFLQHLGVWDRIESGTLGYEEIETLRSLLEGSQVYWQDPTSSEGVTLFASPAAVARYNAQGGKPPQRLKPWVEDQRAKKFPHK